MILRSTTLLFGASLLASVALAQPDPVDAILDAHAQAWWGVLVVDVASGNVHYARNAERNFIPASVTKLYTTAAALDQLGPDYRYETRLYTDGRVSNGVLHGNLVVRGAGDPSTGAPGDTHLALFNAWADSLHARGVSQIRGDVIGDDDVFDDTRLGNSWSWDDLVYGYAAPVSGLTFHWNVIDVIVTPTRPGAAARVSWTPNLSGFLDMVNQATTSARGETLREGYSHAESSNGIIISSTVPMGRIDPESISVPNPTLYFAYALREALLARGIAILGQARDVDELSIRPNYDHLWIIARHQSEPLAELVATTNKDSHNLYAEHLLRTLGVERPVTDKDIEPGSAAMGVASAQTTFAAAEVDTSRLQLVDGSGLSRKNLVSPRMTVDLLSHMARHSDQRIRRKFQASLAIGGIDGTLEHRFPVGTPAYRQVRAKTGSLGNVSALAGYVPSRSGRLLAFAIFCNHFIGKSDSIRGIQDQLVNHFANLP